MSAAAGESILEVRDLHVEIPLSRGTVRAVDGASFSVRRGEALGLVGESGCGKSMTLRGILGLLPRPAHITSGEVLLDGENLVTLPRSRMRDLRGTSISMIFQEPMTALNPVMRVGEQIAEGPLAHLGYSRSKARARALELMGLVGIPDPARRAKAYPHELSGGMRQRVMIAIALSCEPKLILCDEPTTALDVTIQDQILKLLLKLRSEFGMSVVFVTHDLAVVAETCQSVAVMYAGQVVETGTVDEVFHQPRHPYTLGLLRSVPDFDLVRDSLDSIPGAPPDLVDPPGGCRFAARCAFVQPDCLVGDKPLIAIGGGRATACIHPEAAAEAVRADPVIAGG
ncbi:MAG: peptide/nickel transport system ATP-binding protein [Gaiellales bacterium]|nr:peptide/nickel transport system ATP-binding protein [Gaiellales bacterium]